MYSERDNKARKYIQAQYGHEDYSSQQEFKDGWDQALNSEAVKKLVSLLKSAQGHIPEYNISITRDDITKAIEEFNKAKSQGDGE